MSAPFTVCPYRFSADPPAMVRFLDVLGLRRETTTQGDGFAIMRGRRGLVAVHAADRGAVTGVPASSTSLAFVVDDARRATADLAADGYEVAAWDESYAVQGAVRDPYGHGVWLNEPVRDLHGYVAHAPEPSVVDVVAVCWTPDAARSEPFLRRLGFRGPPPAHDGWWPLHAPDGGGSVGLHAHEGDPPAGPWSADDPVSPAALVGLSFWTAEPLDDLGARLEAAGHPVRDDRDATAPHLTVTDPDGVEIELHQAG
jgi:catechol 2,3-dioxygenase-like lactoylglutathione lyase family enzyme